MGKLLSAILILSLLLLLILASFSEDVDEMVEPETFTSGSYSYLILDDGTVEISKYLGNTRELDIPDTLDGLQVSSIGKNAFRPSDRLRRITIPDSVRTIKANPFHTCHKLTEILISPDHPYLAAIDGALFSKQDKRLICVPQGMSLSTYDIPSGIKTIGESAFSGCSGISVITIPDSVTEIGDNAFSSCSGIRSITIPNSVTRLGDSAFSSCSALTTITIPDSVETIGRNPFSGCENLSAINVSPEHQYLATINGVLFIKPENKLICMPEGLNLRAYDIPQGIRMIGDYAFYSCQKLTKITIPDSVTELGAFAFQFCSGLESIAIPESMIKIGKGIFQFCSKLTSITIPKNVNSIGQYAFMNCDNLTVTVWRDSYAAQYCKENNVRFTYPEANDWLND